MTQSILPHNIVNDTRWQRDGSDWICFPTNNVVLRLKTGRGGKYVVNWRPFVLQMIQAPSLPAAKLEALRLVREAVMAEAEAWR